jgi:hypothetical protein
MAVNQGPTGQNQSQAAPAAQATPQQGQPAAQAQRPVTGGISQINERFGRTGRAEGSDARSTKALTVFAEQAKQCIATQDLLDDFTLYRFDRNQHRVGMSAILVTKVARDAQGKTVIVVRPLIVVDNHAVLKPKVFQIPNGYNVDNFEVKPDAVDVFTPLYWARLAAYVQVAAGHPTADVRSAGPLSLHGDFDLEDNALVRNVLITSVNRCDDMVARLGNERPFSLATDVKGSDEQLAARIDYSALPVHTTTGVPVRNDICVSLNRVKKPGQGQVQENEYFDADSNFNQVSLFVNLEIPPQQVPQQQVYGMPPMPPAPPFVPAIVITAVRQANWIMANTLEMHLFAMANSFLVTVGQSWARAFVPSIGKKKDPRDIGAIGYLVAGKKVETKSATFTEQEFAGLMYTQVQQNPIFMIDLDRLGDNAHIDAIYIDAMGGPRRQQAQEAIIRAAHNLYGRENFMALFDHNKEPIITPYGADFHLGYYADEDGELRDIRDLDTLAALNASEGLKDEFMDFYATRANTNVHSEVRLKKSDSYDKQYLGNVTYTGRVHRGMFNPKFIQACNAAAINAGISIGMENVGSVFGGQRFTGNANLTGFAVTGMAQVAPLMNNQQGFAMPMGSTTGTVY